MRRSGIALILLVVAVTACSKSPRTPPEERRPGPRPPQSSPPPKQTAGVGVLRPLGLRNPAVPGPTVGGFTDASAGVSVSGLQATEDGNHPEYNVLFARTQHEAIRLLSEKKLAEALVKFNALRALHNSDLLIPLVIESLTRRIETETNAQQTAANVQAILEAGRIDKAGHLAGDALRQFCNTDSVKDLAALKRQADSLRIARLADRNERFEYFRKEYESAAFDGNKRAALLALEHGLQFGDHADNSQRCRELRSELEQYDALRHACESSECRQHSVRRGDCLTATGPKDLGQRLHSR